MPKQNTKMQLIAFILIYPLLWFIAILPFRVFYIFSNTVYFLIYKVIGYRKKVVRGNLKLAFPNKTHQEIIKIEKKFYRHMCDIFLEAIKSMHISEAEIKKRFVFKNIDVIKKYEQENRSIILVCGHYASWEWMMSLGYYIKHKGFGIYTPIANKYVDKLVRKIRMRHHGFLISRYKTKQTLIEHKKANLLAIYGFASDQSPSPKKAFYWRKFMNVTVPVFTGAEMLAKKLDHVVVYLHIEKIKRGYYETTFKTLAEHPNEFPNYALTDEFTELLEQQIKAKPEYYLWTHKRWKHKDKVPKN